MSGLEPIAALGLACNILQVIGVGRETVRIARQVYQDGALDPALADQAAALDDLSRRVRDTATATTTTTTKTVTSACAPPKPAARDRQLLDLAEKCLGAARDLREEVSFLNGHPSRARLGATLKVAAKTTWRKRRLENLERKLRDAEGLLQTGLLTRIYERSEKNGAGITALDADLRSFLDEYRKGKADAAALVSAQTLRTREHISTETKGSVDAIKTHITQETTQAEGSLKSHITQTATQMEASLKGRIAVAIRGATEREQDARQGARRERLLRSLKFDGMNERKNQVRPSHAGTFGWVLKDGSNGECPESSDSETESWDSFSDWLRSTEPKYWISGKPGSGKTTLIKYLVEHGRTRSFLDIWSPGAVLISYYIWRLGTKTQQSITGLLCSLLYQLFTRDKASLDRTLGDHPKMSIKDAKSDWSEQELQSTLLDVMANYPRSIAIFLDGLDEVLPADGPLRLLEVIDTLARPLGLQGKVKLCLGARREPLYVKRLDTCPQLRLENLNRADLRRYAESNIVIPPDYHTDIPPGSTLVAQMASRVVIFSCEDPPTLHETRDWLVAELVGRAEGVFLWLCLTAKAITEAACQGEAIMDLERRINSLPSDLAELYADMWKRTNGDSDLFRERAALYLRLALCVEVRISPLNMMIATKPGMAARIRDCNLSEPGLATSLLGLCKATIRDVGIRCAGLLESRLILEEDPRSSTEGVPWHGGEYNDLAPYAWNWAPWFRFVHRTARDFLTDTEEGRRILDASTVSEWHIVRRLVEANLANCRLIRYPPICLEPTYPSPMYHLRGLGSALRDCLASIASLLDAPPEQEDNARGECEKLLGFCEQLFNSGQLFGDRRLLNNPKDFHEHPSRGKAKQSYQEDVKRQHEFLLETASIGQSLWPFILAKVKARSLDHQTLSELLLHVCNMGMSRWPGDIWPPKWRKARKRDISVETRLKLAQLLLERGACPTWKGPRRVGDIFTSFGSPVHLLESPLKCLISSVWHLDRGSFKIDSTTASHIMSLIQLLLSHGAALDGEDLEESRVTYHVLRGCLVERPFYWDRNMFGGIEDMLVVVLALPASAILAKLLQTWKARFPEIEAFPELWGLAKDGGKPGRLIAMMHAKGTPRHLWYVENEEELEEELLWVTRAAQHMLQAHDRPSELPIPVEIQEGISQALERRRPERAEGSVDEGLFKFLQKAGMTSIYWEWEEGSSIGDFRFGS